MAARKKILVVDDEVMIRDLLTAVLERADYEVILAEDGLSGVDKAASEKPDLVITDGLLPKLHGFLACRAIKKLNPAPKVILMTGIYTKPTYKWEVIHKYHADDVITKPTGPADLLACVEKHLAGSPAVESVLSAPSPAPAETRDFRTCARLDAPSKAPAASLIPEDVGLEDFFKGWAVPRF